MTADHLGRHALFVTTTNMPNIFTEIPPLLALDLEKSPLPADPAAGQPHRPRRTENEERSKPKTDREPAFISIQRIGSHLHPTSWRGKVVHWTITVNYGIWPKLRLRRPAVLSNLLGKEKVSVCNPSGAMPKKSGQTREKLGNPSKTDRPFSLRNKKGSSLRSVHLDLLSSSLHSIISVKQRGR